VGRGNFEWVAHGTVYRDSAVSCAKMAEPIDMLFKIWTRVDTGKHVLDRGPDPHTGRGNFEGEKGPFQDTPGHLRWSV